MRVVAYAQVVDSAVASVLAQWFKVLSVPSRVQILHELAIAQGSLSHQEIAERVGLTSSVTSMHMSLLVRAKLVTRETVGTRSQYTLNAAMVDAYPTARDIAAGLEMRPLIDPDAPFYWGYSTRRRREEAWP